MGTGVEFGQRDILYGMESVVRVRALGVAVVDAVARVC